MGVDISMYAEVFRRGCWELAEPLVKNPYPWDYEPDQSPALVPASVYSNRNYALFAILANVRNPVRATKPFDCISKARGLPDDLSQPVREHHAHYAADVFGESWFSLDELLGFDWHGKQIVRRGVVDPRVKALFPVGRKRFPFADWPKELPVVVGNQGVGVEVFWTENYAEAVGSDFVDKTLNQLRRYGPPGEVRIVFWFDG